MDSLCRSAAAGPPNKKQRVMFGLDREDVARTPSERRFADSDLWNPALAKFHALTVKKKASSHRICDAKTKQAKLRCGGVFSGCLPPACPRPPLQASHSIGGRQEGIAQRSRRIHVLDCTTEATLLESPSHTGYDMKRCPESPSYDLIKRSDVFVFDTRWRMDRSRESATFLKIAFPVVAFGKTVVGKSDWRGPRPETSTLAVCNLLAA